MAPATKKGSKNNNNRDRRSTSRQSTPLSAIDSAPPTPQTATPTSAAPSSTSMLPKETAYIHTSTAALVSNDGSIETLLNAGNGGAPNSGGGAGAGKNADPPSARELHALHSKIKDTVHKFMTKRGEVCDRSMRQLAQKRKERIAMEREAEAAEAVRIKKEEEEREREKKKSSKKDRERDREKGGSSKKRSHEEMDVDELAEEGEDGGGLAAEAKSRKERRDSLPSVGAHGVARQDGVGVHEGMLIEDSLMSRERVSASGFRMIVVTGSAGVNHVL